MEVELWVSQVPAPFSTISMGSSNCLLAMTLSPTDTFSSAGADDHLPALWRHHRSPPLSAERHITLQAIWEQTVQHMCHNLFLFSFRIWYLDHKAILFGKMTAFWFSEQKNIIYLTMWEECCFLFANPILISFFSVWVFFLSQRNSPDKVFQKFKDFI